MVENRFKIILVALSIAGLMLALSIIQRKHHLHAEIARKLNVHRSMVGKYVLQGLNACRKRLKKVGIA